MIRLDLVIEIEPGGESRADHVRIVNRDGIELVEWYANNASQTQQKTVAELVGEALRAQAETLALAAGRISR